MTEDGFISLCLAFDIVHRYVVAMHMTGKVEVKDFVSNG